MYLEEYIKSLKQQNKQFQNLINGNLDQLLNSNFTKSFVFIPKEAIYTIPIDYKKKIIDSSKNKTGKIEIKEKYWKDLIQ